jgi:hypothetical protein
VDGNKDTNDNTIVTLPAEAATMATMGNTSGSTYAATTALAIAAKVTAAINQVSANQTAIMQHIAAVNISPPPSIAAPAFNIPLIYSVTIPNQNAYTGSGFTQGRSNAPGGGQQRGGRRGGCGGRGRRGRNPFATGMAQHMRQIGGFHGASIPPSAFPGATIPPPMQPPQQQRNANYSNIY